MPLFRRSHRPTSELTRDEVLALLPASVREPGRDIDLTPMLDVPSGDDGPDEDVQFLESLVDSVEFGTPAPKPPRAPAPSRDVTSRDDDALRFFREARDERQRREPLHLPLPEVQIDDLVEELATTAAALRLRKAA